ncbi:hypothetical protein CXG81DRAFT_15422 [Caulochytrium protostelioides]|uniref:Uncharacterized protein n=1 Tax=Caulochytrium protostelioides TaxID=1555241 RepID=A0A4P9WZ90_9FUNG|nr:hypothetical protein CXG81DRAFT_15422 [Caulochytrium protostelioides]|eukprot:RKO98814.1 hypothetical protein CXG81DRAFT_15422 [Caulochytrium protostelioides]
MPSQTTGLVGLPVNPNVRNDLTRVYTQILQRLHRLPADSQYRQSLEAVTRQRMGLLSSDRTTDQIEAEIDEGNLEEVLNQLHRELNLITKMTQWNAHEELEVKPLPDQWTPFHAGTRTN